MNKKDNVNNKYQSIINNYNNIKIKKKNYKKIINTIKNINFKIIWI